MTQATEPINYLELHEQVYALHPEAPMIFRGTRAHVLIEAEGQPWRINWYYQGDNGEAVFIVNYSPQDISPNLPWAPEVQELYDALNEFPTILAETKANFYTVEVLRDTDGMTMAHLTLCMHEYRHMFSAKDLAERGDACLTVATLKVNEALGKYHARLSHRLAVMAELNHYEAEQAARGKESADTSSA